MEPIWNQLYEAAKSALNPREVSRWIEAGGVAAAIETDAGNIYTGVCVDAACTLGICAERNAIFHMLTQGENALRRVVAVDREGKVLPPLRRLPGAHDPAHAGDLPGGGDPPGL